MHNIIKTCALEGATYCAPSHLKDVPKLFFVLDEKNQPNVPTAMMQGFFQMQSKLIGPIKHACHKILFL